MKLQQKREVYFTSDLIRIGCCGIISDPFQLTINPTIKGAISKPFDFDDVNLECGEYEFTCNYFNYSCFSCYVKCEIGGFIGLDDTQCIAKSFNNQSIPFNITFNGPIITKLTSINNYLKDHWTLTVFGFNFYQAETRILIDGKTRCNISFLISTEIG
ncbi:hypothetical protein ACTFIZ_012683 [Dictyostelium cf. discoideum]